MLWEHTDAWVLAAAHSLVCTPRTCTHTSQARRCTKVMTSSPTCSQPTATVSAGDAHASRNQRCMLHLQAAGAQQNFTPPSTATYLSSDLHGVCLCGCLVPTRAGEVPRILRLGAATAITAGLGLAVRWVHPPLPCGPTRALTGPLHPGHQHRGHLSTCWLLHGPVADCPCPSYAPHVDLVVMRCCWC
jgi:hypothetical protein